jgi:hypothetical protein
MSATIPAASHAEGRGAARSGATPVRNPATCSDAGLTELVREVMQPCPCETSRRRSGCVGDVDRSWILDAMLTYEQRRAWDDRRAARAQRAAVNRPQRGAA